MGKTSGNGRDIATRFQKGNPGGPGRPKGSLSITTLIKQTLEETRLCDRDNPGGRTNAQVFVEMLFWHAFMGNAAYAAIIMNRVEGMQVPEPPPPDFNLADAVADAERVAGLREREREDSVE